MAINKVTPRALDKSTDYKLVPSTAFIDALNVVVNEDESSQGDDGGDSGVIKNLRGNTALRFHTKKDVIANGDYKVVGSVTDEKMKLIYFFVYHEDIKEQGVWVYDPYGNLSLPVSYAKKYFESSGIPVGTFDDVDPYQKNTLKCVARGSFFDFKQHSFVTGNVVYSNSLNVPREAAAPLRGGISSIGLQVTESEKNIYEKDFHLYFTDNINEPKKLNVTPSMFSFYLAFNSAVGQQEPSSEVRQRIDINNDGVIDSFETSLMVSTLLGQVITTTPQPLLVNHEGQTYLVEDLNDWDVDNDGSIDVDDVSALLAEYAGPVYYQNYAGDPTGAFVSSEGGIFRLPQTREEEVLFSYACRPTPLSRPRFVFNQDPEVRTNNFEKSKGFKFAYQLVFSDGSESAISPKSEIAQIPSVIYQGNNKNANHLAYNNCRITISDRYLTSGNALGNNCVYVKKVKILAQEGEGAYFIIKEVDSPTDTIVFDFKNDVVGVPVPASEENKFFDSVPQKAEAQAVVGNRLMYGNYVEGYPNSGVTGTLQVIYQDRPNDNFGQPLEIKPLIAIDDSPFNDSIVKNKQSGFRLEIGDNFPVLNEGNVLKFSVSYLPNRNYHVYNAISSYHQSRHWGINNDDDLAQDAQGFMPPTDAGALNIIPDDGVPLAGDNGHIDDLARASKHFSAFSDNGGVASVFWNTKDSVKNSAVGQTEELFLGTSAANPFIIPGSVITFSIDLLCKSNGIGSDVLKAEFIQILKDSLGSSSEGSIALSGDYSGLSTTNFDVIDLQKISETSWDLPISNFQKFDEGSSLSKLVSMLAGDVFEPTILINGEDTPLGKRAKGFVIPKKGRARFRVQNVADTEVPVPQIIEDDSTVDFKVVLDSVPSEGLELWTCIRKWTPGSPWWVLSPTFLSSENIQEELASFFESTEYPLPLYAKQIISERREELDLGPEVPDENIWRFYYNPITSNPNADNSNSLRGVFEQRNDITDFNFRSFEDAGYVSDSDELEQSSRSWVGAVSLKSSVYGSDGQNFISSSSAITDSSQELLGEVDQEFTAGSGLSAGIAYSLLDGEGGPGGNVPSDNLPSSFTHSSRNLLGRNEIHNATIFASSAYGYTGLSGNPFQYSSQSSQREPAFMGPIFTGRIISNGTLQRSASSSSIETAGLQNNSGNSVLTYYDNQNVQFRESEFNNTNKRMGLRTVMPMIQGDTFGVLEHDGNFATELKFSRAKLFSSPSDFSENKKLPFTFALNQSFIENFGLPVFQSLISTGIDSLQTSSSRSFKSNSLHEFGLVFYDNLGRRSFVNSLGSVYIGGFGDPERAGRQGASAVAFLPAANQVIPSWAESYQFVYGGNQTAKNFIQYTTNNAYIAHTGLDLEDVDTNSGKIYVSLNALQSSSISYSKEFGARGLDGGLDVYKFTQGDKLRIISYGPQDERQYPNNIVFDIVDVVTFDELSSEGSPLAPADDNNEKYFGQFVVLSNNAVNSGDEFSYQALLSGQSVWNQNVVFEIFSPSREVPVDGRIYQEIGPVYPVATQANGTKTFSSSAVFNEGDVYFRPVACNTNPADGETIEDLFDFDADAVDGSDDLTSNFSNIFLESLVASDLFSSEIGNFGRGNVFSPNARTVRREAGIIYSDDSDPDSGKFNYSSFNAATYPYKDLEEKFGNINFLDEIEGDLMVIQQSKCTAIPVDSSIISDASGNNQLVTSNQVLGKEIVYAKAAGCDNNPESVVRVDNTFYFAHKSTGKVFRFVGGQGVAEISSAGMSSYFRKQFDEALSFSTRTDNKDVRVVGGWDPVKKEYLLTILRPLFLGSNTSTDNNIVEGCTDPNADNYNPLANYNNGTCSYDGVTETGANGLVVALPEAYAKTDGEEDSLIIDFGEVSRGLRKASTQILGEPVRVTTNGSDPVWISNAYVTAYTGEFQPVDVSAESFPVTFDIQSYSLSPGETSEIDIKYFGTDASLGLGTINGQLNLEFSDNTGTNTAVYRFSGRTGQNSVPEDIGEVTVNFYIGNTLIDQQFVDQQGGTWKIVIDQNRLIKSIDNTFANDGGEEPAGNKAALEVELIINAPLGVTIDQSDAVNITAQIHDQLPGFRFIPYE